MLRRLRFFIILILLNFINMTNCFAGKSINPFQGTWGSEHEKVEITDCNDKNCKIEINTFLGAFSCEVDGKLTVLSSNSAVFYIKNTESDAKDKNKLYPINLSLSKQIITVSIPETSHEAARRHCGARASFEGEYANPNIPKIYKTSFNCDKAKTKIEIAICHSPWLAYADLILSKLYIQLKAKQGIHIVNQQREWIKERDFCSNSINLNQCLSNKYRDRILVLQENLINTHSKPEKIDTRLPYNFDYLHYLSKNSGMSFEILSDPPLQYFLKTFIPKGTYIKISESFLEIKPAYHTDSLIMVQGGAPGLYTICEGALVVTKDHKTWLAYIYDGQIIIRGPLDADFSAIPAPLKKWVNRLKDKDIVYKRLFPSVFNMTTKNAVTN